MAAQAIFRGVRDPAKLAQYGLSQAEIAELTAGKNENTQRDLEL